MLNLDGFLIFNVCLCANVERMGTLVGGASTAEKHKHIEPSYLIYIFENVQVNFS